YFSNNMTAAGVTTPVTVTATDKAGNTASASFNVIVRRPGTAVAPPAAPATTELATTFPCTMSQLGLHDPFIVADQASQTYFLYTAASRQSTTRPCGVPTASYAAGIMAYQSKDLVHWSQASVVYRVTTGADHWNASTAPWAPEVHAYNGKYYLFTTLHNNSSYTIPFTEQPDQTRYNSSSRRSTIIAVSDTATGPFTDLSPEAPVTPYDFMTLDGSLYVDPAGQPYLVYAHEWVQKMDGTVEAIPLTDDLTSAEGDPFLLWRATEVPFYADPLYGGRYDNVLQDKTLNKTQLPGYVTDGVFVVTTPNGSLLTMWTTYRDDRYIVGQAISRTGNIHGPWEQLPEVDYSDAGHSMVFKTFDGQLMMVEHSNMSEGSALGEIFEIAITDDGFVLGQHRQDIDELVGINPQDVLAPKVYPPSTRVATAAKGTAAATVDFLAMARDDADGWVDVTYSKQPGSTFPVGTTKVTVTARDAAGNVGTASFNVVVKPYPTVGAGSVTLTGSTALGGVLHANAVAPTQDSNGQDITATVTYRWLRNGTAIAGATGVDYTTVGADAGQLISVQATFSAPEADSSAAVSAEVMITATAGPNVKYEFFSLTPDLEGNGRGDILAVEASTGALYLQTTTASGDLSVKTALAASGLNGHRVYGPGDWNSDGKADVITVDVAGNMWLRAGNGAGKVAAPVQCGRGWSAYRIVPSGDLNGDKLNDLLAIDSAGKLWLYAGNGKGGFLPGRTEVGHGWTSFELYAAGDLNKDGKADILGISANGDLYAYMGKGNGQFQAAKYVGRGWGTFTLASGADLNGDGMADIVGRNDSNGTLYFYSGTGTGFGQAKKIASGW
ncbi:MAG: family 43 glycosylhydrolase, partial [Bifidobacteriaceae bacterium]|nr:family 43 glycosylhydrolase [Bifidobacteriaceae bacterium]